MKGMRAVTWNKSKDTFALMVGHGKSLDGSWDPGCTYGNYTEAGLMLDIVKVAVKWLRKSGVKVITDADDANNRNMKASVAWANNKKAKCYMSVHCDNRLNATTKSPSGIAPLYVSAAGKKMADKVGKSIAKTMGMKWLGPTKRTDLYELNATTMTSVILETGFIKADLTELKNYKKYGRALAKGICKYIGVTMYVSPRTKLKKEAALTFAEMTKLKFKYQVSGNATSWTKAKKKRTSNCATYMTYILQRAGYLNDGQVFWCNDGVVKYRGKGTEAQLKKNFKIIHPKKEPKTSGVKAADICGYSKPAHTQMLSSWDGKTALWFSFGPSDVNKKLPRKRGSYNTKKIDTIIRLK